MKALFLEIYSALKGSALNQPLEAMMAARGASNRNPIATMEDVNARAAAIAQEAVDTIPGKVTNGTPANAAAAKKVLTVSGAPAADDTVSIAGVTYKFVEAMADPQVANDVLIGTTAETAIDNLVLAVTKGTGEGTNYGTGTVANPYVTAAKTTASTMTATAKLKGEGGNSHAIAKSGANLAWEGGATLSGGVTGTVGKKADRYVDDTYEYLAVADNDGLGSNWVRRSLGTTF